MPMIDADGCLLNVSVEGRDGGPTLMLSNSLGCTLQMWEPQMKALTQLFRVIRYDRRGHGKSGVPPGPYSMERFGRDVLAILDDLNIEKAHWCGLSMGGMVGQWLGANAPERFGKIILANTACHYPDPTNWHNRIKAVQESGIAGIADTVIAAWLTADFREREPQITANVKAMLLATPVQGYVACCEALSTLDQRALLPKIKSPTLVIAGRHDMSTPVAAGEFIRSQIPGRLNDSRRRAYFQRRTVARLHRRRGRLPDAALVAGNTNRYCSPSFETATSWPPQDEGTLLQHERPQAEERSGASVSKHGQPTALQDSVNCCPEFGDAQATGPTMSRCYRSAAKRDVRPPARSRCRAAATVRSHAAEAPRSRRPARPAPCWRN